MDGDDSIGSSFSPVGMPYISPPLSQPESEPTDMFSGSIPAIELGSIPAVHFSKAQPTHFGPAHAVQSGPVRSIRTGPATAFRLGVPKPAASQTSRSSQSQEVLQKTEASRSSPAQTAATKNETSHSENEENMHVQTTSVLRSPAFTTNYPRSTQTPSTRAVQPIRSASAQAFRFGSASLTISTPPPQQAQSSLAPIAEIPAYRSAVERGNQIDLRV